LTKNDIQRKDMKFYALSKTFLIELITSKFFHKMYYDNDKNYNNNISLF
jgi:hypothetical protein